MKKLACFVLLLAIVCMPALAEDVSVAGTCAGYSASDDYFAVSEGASYALIRANGGDLRISDRADSIGSLVNFEDALYYLRCVDGIWQLVRRAASEAVVYTFENGDAVSALSARDKNLFVLVNGRIHIVYPSEKLCIKLVNARMSEYVLIGDDAYFVSSEALSEYSAETGGEVITARAGSLSKVNLSTGKISLVVDHGVSDLTECGGRLYFHSFMDRYIMGSDDARIRGRLYSYDPALGRLACESEEYDWGYVNVGRILQRRAGGLFEPHAAEPMISLKDTDEIGTCGSRIIVFDPEKLTLASYDISD